MKIIKVIYLMVFAIVLLVNVIADTFTQFNNNDISGNMSFVNLNNITKYFQLNNSAKIKNATIMINGYVNLTQNNSFSGTLGGNGHVASNKSSVNTYLMLNSISDGFEYELFSSDDSSNPFNNVIDKYNFSNIEIASGNLTSFRIRFNKSELYVLDFVNLNAIKLHRMNISNATMYNLSTYLLDNNIRGFDFDDNGSMYSCGTNNTAGKATLIRRHKKDDFAIVEQNWTPNLFGGSGTSTGCRDLFWDGITFWVSPPSGLDANPFRRLDKNNYNFSDFNTTQEANAGFYDSKNIYLYVLGSTISKFHRRGLPFDVRIGINSSTRFIYRNTSEIYENDTLINLNVTEINNIIFNSNCTNGCNLSIVFNSTGGNLAYSNINITQNEVPNATNVSITPLPLNEGTNAKGHANYSDADGDIVGGNQTYWYVNDTLILEANNSFSLLSGNVTPNANIIFSARFNDTFDWGDWANSTNVTVGDLTSPILNNCTLSSTSITDASGNTINLTCQAIDASSNIETMVACLNGTINKTLTFSVTQSPSITSTYRIFQSLETLLVGSYSICQVNVTDTSLNKLSNTTKDLHFEVTSAPSGGGGTPSGGGGGGGLPLAPQCKENELLVGGVCVNASLFNVTFKVIGLTNIQPIVFYRTCGKFQEFRQLIRTNKILKNAEFDKKQLNTNITIIGSDALVVKKLRISGISERIDMGNLKLTDTTQQVARVFISLKIISLCNPLTYMFVVIPIIIIIFRKKIAKIINRT